MVVGLTPMKIQLYMGNDRHIRILVWKWALLAKGKETFLAEGTGLSFPRMCTCTVWWLQ